MSLRSTGNAPALRKFYQESYMLTLYSLDAGSLLLKDKHDVLFAHLTAYLNNFQTDISESGGSYVSFDVTGKADETEEFDPMGDDQKGIWQKIATDRRSLPRAKLWFNSVIQTLREGVALWEFEEVQIAELPATVFAATHREFVPYYTQLLKLWDLSHEVYQTHSIVEIIEAHGMCPETEELLVTRFTDELGGYPGEELDFIQPILDAHYGDFEKSDLYKRINEVGEI